LSVSEQVRGTDRIATGLPPRPHLPLAEGIIMGLNRCSPEEAFGQLRDVSRRHGIGVRVLASALVQAAMSGEAPRTAEEHERAEVLALYWPLPMPTSRGRDVGTARLPQQDRHREAERHQVVDLRHAD
jgi:ANTAR domain-containing protein